MRSLCFRKLYLVIVGITHKALQGMGEEVIAQILELLGGLPSTTAWHGACLSLAECARRRVLTVGQLDNIAPYIAKALQMDIRRGAHRSVPSLLPLPTPKHPHTLLFFIMPSNILVASTILYH